MVILFLKTDSREGGPTPKAVQYVPAKRTSLVKKKNAEGGGCAAHVLESRLRTA